MPARGKYFFLFLVLSIACVWRVWVSHSIFAGGIWCFIALSPILLAVAYAGNLPFLLGKRPDGSRHVAARVALLPYDLLNQFLLHLSRGLRIVQPPVEVAPGVWVGPRPLAMDRHRLPTNLEVIDMTAEFAEVGFLARGRVYHCFPVLDGTAPSTAQFRGAIESGITALRDGPVYIHCASGHSRSVAVAAGILVVRGDAPDPRAAVALIRAKRPKAHPTEEQLRALEGTL